MQRYDDTTALVVVDVQNDFADPKGSLSVTGGVSLIPQINGEIATATSAGATVVATQDWHPESTPHFAEGRRHLAGPLRRRDVGRRAASRPRPADDAPRVRKGTNGEDGYSGFTMRDPVTGEEKPTELDALLQRARHRAGRRRRARDRLLRPGHAPSTRCGSATGPPC